MWTCPLRLAGATSNKLPIWPTWSVFALILRWQAWSLMLILTCADSGLIRRGGPLTEARSGRKFPALFALYGPRSQLDWKDASKSQELVSPPSAPAIFRAS